MTQADIEVQKNMSSSELAGESRDTHAENSFSIIGIGATNTDLPSLLQFLQQLPPTFPHAIIIGLVTATDYKQICNALQEQSLPFPILKGEAPFTVQPAKIYLLAENCELLLESRQCVATASATAATDSLPFNLFLESLARRYRESAIGIAFVGSRQLLLSGLRAIWDVGGLVIMEEGETAVSPAAEKAPFINNLAGFVLPPDQMARQLLNYLATVKKRPRQSQLSLTDQAIFRQIIQLLQKQTGHDFSLYKPNTLLRRLQRRLLIANISQLSAYHQYLIDNPAEIRHLYQDFLIGVTWFFRDPEAWELIATQVLPTLLQNRPSDQPIKAWVVGSSSGEDAYSLAILLAEAMQKSQRKHEYKIFATDIDKEKLRQAMQGIYPKSSAQAVSPARLATHFTKTGKFYQVNRALQRPIIFTQHNALQDTPFAKLDLIVCRNLLIYLQPKGQQKLVERLHYSLKLDGALFLGPSETLGSFAPHFTELSHRWRIFKNVNAARILGQFTTVTSPFRIPQVTEAQDKQQQMLLFADALNEALLHELEAACVFIDESFRVLHAIGQYNDYLTIPEGGFSINLPQMVPASMRPVVITAVHKAATSNERVFHTGAWKPAATNQRQPVHLLVTPVSLPNKRQNFAVVFLPQPIQESELASAPAPVAPDADDMATAVLQQALQETQASLQAILEQAQTSQEALQANNEELESANEELFTLNTEYQRKIEELDAVNADKENLLRSTGIGTIFLDENLRIRSFTPAIESQFNLLEADIGRPLAHLAASLKPDDLEMLQTEIESVLQSGTPVEREILAQDGRYYLARIHPFINSTQQIGGTVLTFVDVHPIKTAAKKIEALSAQLSLALEAGKIGIWDWDFIADTLIWDDTMYALYGIHPDEFSGAYEAWQQTVHPDDFQRANEEVQQAITGKAIFDTEFRILKQGETRYIKAFGRIFYGEDGQPQRLVGVNYDITSIRQAKAQNELILRTALDGFWVVDANGRFENVNDAYVEMIGYSRAELLEMHISDVEAAVDRQAILQAIGRIKETGAERLESRHRRKDGEIIQVELSITFADLDGGKFFTFVRDITARKKAEIRKRRYQQMFNATEDLVTILDRDLCYLDANRSYLDYWQQSRSALLGRHVLDVISKDLYERLLPRLQRCLAGEYIRFQEWVTFPEIGRHYMDIHYSPLRRSNGEIEGVTVSVHDITEIKESEEKLSAALAELSQSNQDLEQFAYAASHDLQEPMNTIINFIGLLEEDYKNKFDKDGRAIMNHISGGAQRMKDLVNALLQYSRLRHTDMTSAPIDSHKLIHTLLIDLQSVIENTGATIDYNEGVTIVANEALLRQLLQNLLSNAMKFHRPGIPPEIQIQFNDEGDNWHISVQDNGIGIDPKYRDEVFGLFRRLHLREEYQGTGLGLALCKQIVERHSGQIWFTAVPEGGTIFHVTLPKLAYAPDNSPVSS